MDSANLLAHSLSPDRTLREEATQQLERFAQENYASYANVLIQQLTNTDGDPAIRMAAGLAIKNSLSAKEYARKEEQAKRWLALDENSRAQIKQGALLSLAATTRQVGRIAGQVIAAIAEIELPMGQWLDLIRLLLDNITNTDNADLKISTLEAIGYVCEATNPIVLAAQSNEILTAVVQGARKEEQNSQVRLAALRALINSLEFVRSNFEREGERNFIMQVVCEATQSDSEDVTEAAFECLVRIMQLYYDKMQFYMEKALFGLTVAGMNHSEDKVALQAIEFWSTVCEEEISLKEAALEAVEFGLTPERNLYNFAEAAMNDVLPVLLWLLTKQEEDADEDEWNVSMSAATCLTLYAQCVRNIIIGPIVPFVESNIQNTDWHYREASVMAFGSILDGPDVAVVMPLVDRALPTLIGMMTDPMVQVKDTVAWTLGRVCELLIGCIKPEIHLRELISALVLGLQDNPRIVGNCCWALMNLAEQTGPVIGSDAPTSPLSMYFEDITKALLQFTEQATNESNGRTSAYEATSSLVMFSANDCISIVQQIALTILDRLEASIALENEIVGADQRIEHNELQSNLLGLLTNCIRRLSKDIMSISDRVMTALLQLLTNVSKQSTTAEDAFLAVGAMINALESDFVRYAEPFIPTLYIALQNTAEYQLCSIAVGLVGDLCRALGEVITPYCNTFMQLLVADLQSPTLHRTVKPNILSCFGDMALAINDKFEPYLEVVMIVLQQAGSMRSAKDNYEMIDYVNTLHEGVIEAYVGIVQGFNGTQKVGNLLQFMPSIFQLIHDDAQDIHRSDDLTRAMVGLIGDLADTFGPQLKQLLQTDWVMHLIREAKTERHYGITTRETARWAKEMVKRAIQ
ncbi:ARM repeat-containing protein [Lichtheimia hyalospora FSU 10163]|nr:ARM repeat-containing protein [Lichtheimia hyalospora FSU 10163]